MDDEPASEQKKLDAISRKLDAKLAQENQTPDKPENKKVIDPNNLLKN